MSESKPTSPLLDGFSMGNPISSHDGILCCPAIRENTDKKYIVKIISVPASQTQMDALLLAGAYKDPADAMEYFREMGEGILKEAEQLKTLSKLDGFLAYDAWTMEPITKRRLGYEIYLVGSYKRSLDKYVRSNPVTHLEAINLGLDLCAALSVCRQAGWLSTEMKPRFPIKRNTASETWVSSPWTPSPMRPFRTGIAVCIPRRNCTIPSTP